MTEFTKRVLDIVKKIPTGRTMSYKQVAVLAGSPKAARVVGSIMAKNQDISIPCHRIIKSNGIIGEYNGLRGRSKQKILTQEKIDML